MYISFPIKFYLFLFVLLNIQLKYIEHMLFAFYFSILNYISLFQKKECSGFFIIDKNILIKFISCLNITLFWRIGIQSQNSKRSTISHNRKIQLAEITYKWQLHISYFTLLFNSAIQQFCMNVLFNWESTAYVFI